MRNIRGLLSDFGNSVEEDQGLIAVAGALGGAALAFNLAFAYVLEVVALAGAGRSAEAHQLAASAVGDERFAEAPFDPRTFAMPYLGWLEGDLDAVERHASQMLAIGERFGLEDTIATAHYFLGSSAFERNRLQEADEHLAITLDLRLVTQTIIVVHAEMALALSAHAQGRGAEADKTAAAMMEHVLDTRSEFHQPVARAFLAELHLRCGRHAAALRWRRRPTSSPSATAPCSTTLLPRWSGPS